MTEFRITDSVNTEKFLNVIRNYPILYAVGRPDYLSVKKKNKAWEEIQATLNTDVEIIKAKWRNLRDTYRKYRRSHDGIEPDKTVSKYSKWIWADKMSFIDDANITDDCVYQDSDTNITDPNIRDIKDVKIEIVNEYDFGTDISTYRNELPSYPEPELEVLKTKDIPKKRKSKRITKNKAKVKILGSLEKGRSKVIAKEKLANVPCDRLDMEFLGFANTVKKFSSHKQAVIKLRIAKIITEAQLKEVDTPSSADNYLAGDYDDNVEEFELEVPEDGDDESDPLTD